MNAVKHSRQQLGLSQAALADLLGISRSIITMAEGGFRELPMTAWIRLNQLVASSPEKEPDFPLAFSSEKMSALEEEFRNVLLLRLNGYETRLLRLQKQLNKMRSSHALSKGNLNRIEDESKLFVGVDEYLEKLTARRIVESEAYYDTHPLKQRALELAIAELSHSISLLRSELEIKE